MSELVNKMNYMLEKSTEIMTFNCGNKMELLGRLINESIYLDGDLAEVGVCGGGSAVHINKVVTENKSEKQIHLFDTFEGLPYEDNLSHATVGDFKPSQATIDDIFKYFKDFPNVNIYKGLFNEQCHHVAERKFNFVHLDVDQALSYQQCLDFFYPRMVPGGIILMDEAFHPDYQGASNVIKDFFKHKPEKLVPSDKETGFIIKV
jgi:hypothetical protein